MYTRSIFNTLPINTNGAIHFNKNLIVYLSLFIFILSLPFKTQLLGHPPQGSLLYPFKSQHDQNCNQKCNPFTWEEIKGAHVYLIYARGKPIYRKLARNFDENEQLKIKNLLQKQRTTSTFHLVVLNKRKNELASFKIRLNCGQLNICQPPRILNKMLAIGAIGEPYRDVIQVSPTFPAAILKLIKGTLPDGLTLSRDGTIAGIPEETGIFDFSVRAKSRCGSSKSYDLRVIIDCPKIIFITTSLPNGEIGLEYSESVRIFDADPVTTFEIVLGDLPPGFTLSTQGTLSGSPTEAGSYTFSIQAVNQCRNSATSQFSLIIEASCTSPTITTTSLPDGYTLNSYFATIATSGGVSPITFAITNGSLPNGLVLSENGDISGSPDQSTVGQIFNFTIQATSSCDYSTDQQLSITIGST